MKHSLGSELSESFFPCLSGLANRAKIPRPKQFTSQRGAHDTQDWNLKFQLFLLHHPSPVSTEKKKHASETLGISLCWMPWRIFRQIFFDVRSDQRC